MAKLHPLYRRKIPPKLIPMVLMACIGKKINHPVKAIICFGGGYAPRHDSVYPENGCLEVGITWLSLRKTLWNTLGKHFIGSNAEELERFFADHTSNRSHMITFDAFRDDCLDLCEAFPDLPESKALADRVKYLSAVGALQAAAHAR